MRIKEEPSLTETVAEASSPSESQTTGRRRGRLRKNLENPQDFKEEVEMNIRRKLEVAVALKEKSGNMKM